MSLQARLPDTCSWHWYVLSHETAPAPYLTHALLELTEQSSFISVELQETFSFAWQTSWHVLPAQPAPFAPQSRRASSSTVTTHAPCWHESWPPEIPAVAAFVAQRTPQPPQLFTSELVSAQRSLQNVCPPEHAPPHAPFVHVGVVPVAVHFFPHAPQLFGSAFKSAHHVPAAL